MAYISQIKLSDTTYDISAYKLKNARTIFGKSFDGTANVAGKPLVYGTYTSTAANRYANCGIEVRENGLVGSAQSDIGYAPSIGFHWSGRMAASLLFHSDGNFYLKKQDGTSRASLDANLIGNASSATKLQTARTLTIGSAGKTFDGTANVSWTPYEMQVTKAEYGTYDNMNIVADTGNALGMANLVSSDTTINPGGQTGWHHYINMTWSDAKQNNGNTTNEWCTQIANKCGTTDLWVRSRSGGSITDGTAWGAPWTRILTANNYSSYAAPKYHTHTIGQVTWNASENLICNGDNSEWSIDMNSNAPNSYFHIWSGYLGNSCMKFENKTGLCRAPYGVYGGVWNDYAEYRNQKEDIEPGYCVASADNGQVYKTTEKFQACDGIVSDTFGFAIGETDECKTPLAVAGRVLAYCEGDRYSYHSGDTVCAGPDGRVVKMTREEIREWPDRIVGIVSEIPEYETWGTGNVLVDGRIWIKVK